MSARAASLCRPRPLALARRLLQAFQPFCRLIAPISKRRSPARMSAPVSKDHINWEQSMLGNTGQAIGLVSAVLITVFGAVRPTQAQERKAQDTSLPYPNMAPIEQYRMNRDAEIALA